MEIWRKIEGHYTCSVSTHGRVRNDITGKILKQNDNGKGYMYVRFIEDKKLYKYYVHRLVAQAFIPNPDNLSDVNHIDEVKQNNNLSNLEWLSHRDNIMHGTCRLRRLQNLTGPAKPKPVIVDNILFRNRQLASEFIGCKKSALDYALYKGLTEFRGHTISYA